MGLILLLAIVVVRLLVFFLGRHYNKPFKFGWMGAFAFGGITGMAAYIVFAHRAYLGHSQDYYWLIPIVVFAFGFFATLGLDQHHSRWIPLAVAWHLIVMAVLCFVLVAHIRQDY